MNPFAGTAVLAACALCAAYLDARYRRLPNWLALITAFAGFVFLGLEQGLPAVPWAAGHALIALIVGAALFRFSIIGGGDAKFYAGCAAWVVLQEGLKLLLIVSLAGLVLVLVWFAIKGIRRVTTEAGKGVYAQVPYGIAIAAGAMIDRVLS